MTCARCGAAAHGPLSVTENVHKMACTDCATKWREVRANVAHRAPAVVLAVFRCFMDMGRKAA